MFEHSLIDLAAKKRSRRAWISLPVAIGLHVAAITTVTFASYWDVRAVPDPKTNDIFFVSVAPPPPPLLGSGEHETKPPTTKPVDDVKPVVPQQPVQPSADQPERADSPVLESVLPPGGDPRGSEHGVENGDPDFGVEYSTGPGGPGLNPVIVVPVDDRPIQVGGPVLRPEILFRTEPRYTEVARRAGVEGVVILKAVIDEHGNVVDVTIQRSQPMGLDQAAIDAVRQWRFKPATLNGRAVKVYYSLTVSFKIQR